MDNRAPDTSRLYVPQVLLVEKDTEVAALLSSALAMDSLGITWVRTRQEALERVAKGGFDLIILDLGLPKKGTLEFLKDFQAKEQPQVPIILLSGWTGSREKLASFEHGALDYIAKPFEVLELRARVRSLLKARKGNTHLVRRNQELQTACSEAQ